MTFGKKKKKKVMLFREGKGRLLKHRSAEANATKTSNQKEKGKKREIFHHFFFSFTPNMLILIHMTADMTADIWESDDDVFVSNFNVPEFLIKGKVGVSSEGSLGALSAECQVLMHQPHSRTIPECFLQR